MRSYRLLISNINVITHLSQVLELICRDKIDHVYVPIAALLTLTHAENACGSAFKSSETILTPEGLKNTNHSMESMGMAWQCCESGAQKHEVQLRPKLIVTLTQ